MKLIFLCIIMISLLDAKMQSRTQVAMGTFVTITLPQKYEKSIEGGFGVMRDVERALSSYDKRATIYRLNQAREVKLDSYTYEALALSLKYYKRTHHYFNIAVGSVTKDLYRFGEDEQLPTNIVLKSSLVDLNALHFNKDTAYLDRGVKIDLGGMGKGFGVDKVAAYLRKNHIDEGVIAASGDIRCLSITPISIQDPFGDAVLARFTTKRKDMAISTSGNYNRYVKSPKHNHLINPKTKASEDKFISITLISNLANSDIDAYATAASVMQRDEAYAFLDSLALAYIVMQSDKKVVVSKNIDTYTQALLINDAYKENP